MSQYEILHSGQYWQDLRRRAKEAKAAHAAQEELQADTLGPNLCNGAHVYTFVPGSAVPFTSLQQRNGKLLPLSGPSSTQKHEAAKLAVLDRRRRAKEKARAARVKKLEEVLGSCTLSARLLTSSAGSGRRRCRAHSTSTREDARSARRTWEDSKDEG
ncbi:hypothetical protein B0H14DRAFT_2617749 [Mycena olivaceomarginata]|nr:hypothetical protein B0H14DRAFT_2617749 [Mycena olivaceomarginata]